MISSFTKETIALKYMNMKDYAFAPDKYKF